MILPGVVAVMQTATGGGSPGGGPYTGTLTIASGTVSSTLTNFPVLVDLAHLPAGFWAAVDADGGDIRVTESDGSTLVPIDVLRIDTGAETGALFFKAPSIASGSDTVFKIKAGHGDTALDPTDANGRNAVWSDYHRVFTGDSATDRTGSGSNLALNGDLIAGGWAVTAQSPDLSTAHQGVCWDGTHYYVTDTNAIRKYDASWSLVASNTDPLGDTGITAVNHCGDLDVYNGELYIPVEEYPNSPYDNQHIAVFSASTLAFLRSYDISAQGREVSSIAYNPADGLLYVADFDNGATIPKYSLTGVYQGTLTLSSTISLIQGITFFGGKLYINSPSGGNRTWEATLAGTVNATPIFKHNFTGDWEGLGHTDEGLIALNDGTLDLVWTLQPGWFNFTNAGYGVASSLTKFTSWTMGATVVETYETVNHAILSYSEAGTGDTTRATLALRSTPAFGIWNSTDSWATDALNPDFGTHYRLAYAHDGTTSRKLYRNGSAVATDLACAQRPGGLGNTLYVGVEDATLNEEFVGSMNYIYLRNGILSDAWLAAEAVSWRTPSSFYAIT